MDYSGILDAAKGAFSNTGQGSYGSGLIGGIGDMVIGPVMANVQKGWAAKSARHAREFAMHMMREGPRIQMEALRKAGLNPILAATKGYQFDAPSVAAAQTPQIRMEGSLSRAMSSGRQAGLFGEQRRLLSAEADTAELGRSRAVAEIEEKGAHAVALKAEAGAASAREVRDQAEAVRSVAETERVGIDRARIEALTKQIGVETELKRRDIPRKEVMEQVFKDLGEIQGTLPKRIRGEIDDSVRHFELRTGQRYDLKTPEGRARWRSEHP